MTTVECIQVIFLVMCVSLFDIDLFKYLSYYIVTPSHADLYMQALRVVTARVHVVLNGSFTPLVKVIALLTLTRLSQSVPGVDIHVLNLSCHLSGNWLPPCCHVTIWLCHMTEQGIQLC